MQTNIPTEGDVGTLMALVRIVANPDAYGKLMNELDEARAQAQQTLDAAGVAGDVLKALDEARAQAAAAKEIKTNAEAAAAEHLRKADAEATRRLNEADSEISAARQANEERAKELAARHEILTEEEAKVSAMKDEAKALYEQATEIREEYIIKRQQLEAAIGA